MFGRRGIWALAWLLGAGLSATAMAAVPPVSAPSPVEFASVTPRLVAGGAQTIWPITVNQEEAMAAIFQGGMWLPNPSGEPIYAKYARHILHRDGTWTWVGKVATRYGEQSVVLTFGKDAVYGHIPQPSGAPLRIVTTRGKVDLLQTDTTLLAHTNEWRNLRQQMDYLVPPRTFGVKPAAMPVPPATAANPATIDVMVVYTPGFVSARGGAAAAATRIHYLVDLTNQAYVDSGVNQRIRLVHSMEVNYPDNTLNSAALNDITEGNGSTPPASLQAVAATRVQYGADLVALVRSFSNTAQGDCGEGWLNGGGEVAIVPSQNKGWGYSVVSDGSDAAGGGYYCADITFAHELGHNMGNAHDRANSNGAGAYAYSYGYLGTGTSGFATIMAYSRSGDTQMSLFSNPNISSCLGAACGIADSAADSADNAHSMNNTAALIAQFEPTMVSSSAAVHNDVDGDGKSDLIWFGAGANQLTYWLMNGASTGSQRSFPVPAGYQPVATGDFYGTGRADLVWMDAAGGTYLWSSDGSGGFTNSQVAKPMPGWKVVGATDIDGDGRSDLIWYNAGTGQMTYWLMNGSAMTQWGEKDTNPGLRLLATGDFDGDGHGDLLWELPNGAMYMWLADGAGGFSSQPLGPYPAGWLFAGAESLDASGHADLLWYNPASGQMTYWLMNGASVASWSSIWTSTGLTPLATGSFDGANAGLVWGTSTGAMYMWLFSRSNPASLGYYSLGAYPAGYIPLP